MKRLFLSLFLISLIVNLFAEISVKSFRKLENDLDARVNAPIIDFNGDVSAIIKIVTTQTGFTFDCGQAGIVKTINKPSEIWVYVPFGVKRITIMHPQLGQLRDWTFTQPIEKASVYEMVLVTGKVITTVEETIESQWLVITPEPIDAAIYIDDAFVKTGTYQTKLKPGSYSYRIEAPLYHTEAGKIEITDAKKEISAKLKPAFGFIDVNSEPEKDAKVIIDGKTLITNTPCKTQGLASGEHTVQVIKEMYQPSTQKVTITDGQTTPLNFKLQPSFAELNIITSAEATLYVNNEKKATGTWNGRLNPGVYSLEARMDKYHSAKQDIELTVGDVKTVNLQPTPIYGSLDIITTPVGATISINGKDYGTTPNTISKLLVGEYIVQLSKNGFATKNIHVSINEGLTAVINENLIEKMEVELDVDCNSPFVINSVLYDNHYSYKISLLQGIYTLITPKSVTKFTIKDNNPQRIKIKNEYDSNKGVENEIIIYNFNIIEGKKYSYINLYNKGKFLTVKSNDMYGCIDLMGNEVLPVALKYKEIGQFSDDGFAPAIVKRAEAWSEPDEWAIIDRNGQEITKDLHYRYINQFSEGLAWVVLNNKMGCIDKNGKVVIPIIYDQQLCGEGIWCHDIFINDRKIVSKDGKFGLIDKNNNQIIPFIYDDMEVLSMGIYKVKSNERYVLIDKNGKILINVGYIYIGSLSEDRICVKNENKFGYIDVNGNLIIPLKFDFLENTNQWIHYIDCKFYDGKAEVRLNGVNGTIDKNGNFTPNN